MNFANLLTSVFNCSNVHMREVIAPKKFIRSENSTLIFSKFSIQGFWTVLDGGLLDAASSVIQWSGGTLQRLWTNTQVLMTVKASTLRLSGLTVTAFNGTLVWLSGGSVDVRDCYFSDGVAHLRDMGRRDEIRGAVLQCIGCQRIAVARVIASNVTAAVGGFAYAVFTAKASFSVRESIFQHCFATHAGGAIYSKQATFQASGNMLAQNNATDGGAFFLHCTPLQFSCDSEVTDSVFDSNSAVSGGAIRWYERRPVLRNNSYMGNRAEYGPNEASDAVRLSLIDPVTRLPIEEIEYSGVPGQLVPVPLLIGLVDSIGQLVATDNTSYINIEDNFQASFYGPSRLMAVNGFANYSAFIITAPPGKVLTISVYSESIPTQPANYPRTSWFGFQYPLRDCIPGEYSERDACYRCPRASYSLRPEQECTACPLSATCNGGSSLSLKAGYWRASPDTDKIESCFNEDACEGGINSTCAEGFTSNLCGQCADGWYQVGKFSCFKCPPREVLFAKVFLLGAGYLVFLCAAITFTLRKLSCEEQCRSAELMSLLRHLLLFVQSMMLISGLKTEWNTAVLRMFEVMEFFGTLVLGSFSSECFFDSLPPIYLKLIIVSAGFTIFILLLESIRQVIRQLPGRNHNYISAIELFALLLLQPVLIKYAVSLFDCERLDNGNWLTEYLSERCWEGRHRFLLLTLALPTLLLFGLGALLLLWAVTFHPKCKHHILRVFLAQGYHPRYSYWELVCLGTRLTLAVAIGVLGGLQPKVQILAASIVVFAAVYLQAIFRPLLLDRVQTVAQSSLITIFLYVVIGFYNHYFGKSVPVVRDILSYLSFAVLALFLGRFSLAVAQCLWLRNARVVEVAQIEQSSYSLSVPNNSMAKDNVVSPYYS